MSIATANEEQLSRLAVQTKFRTGLQRPFSFESCSPPIIPCSEEGILGVSIFRCRNCKIANLNRFTQHIVLEQNPRRRVLYNQHINVTRANIKKSYRYLYGITDLRRGPRRKIRSNVKNADFFQVAEEHRYV